MKKIWVVSILLFSSLLVVAQDKRDAQNVPKSDDDRSDWVLVARTPSNITFRHSKRLSKTAQGTVLSWEKNIPRTDTREGEAVRQKAIDALREQVDDEKAGTYSYNVGLREYDCKEQKNRYLGMWFYDKQGKLIYQSPKWSGEWSYSPPNSIGEVTMKAACEAVTKIPAP